MMTIGTVVTCKQVMYWIDTVLIFYIGYLNISKIPHWCITCNSTERNDIINWSQCFSELIGKAIAPWCLLKEEMLISLFRYCVWWISTCCCYEVAHTSEACILGASHVSQNHTCYYVVTTSYLCMLKCNLLNDRGIVVPIASVLEWALVWSD